MESLEYLRVCFQPGEGGAFVLVGILERPVHRVLGVLEFGAPEVRRHLCKRELREVEAKDDSTGVLWLSKKSREVIGHVDAGLFLFRHEHRCACSSDTLDKHRRCVRDRCKLLDALGTTVITNECFEELQVDGDTCCN
jgi:hypothetical protein